MRKDRKMTQEITYDVLFSRNFEECFNKQCINIYIISPKKIKETSTDVIAAFFLNDYLHNIRQAKLNQYYF